MTRTESTDLVLKAIAHERRRAVCRYLADHRPPVSSEDVLAHLQTESPSDHCDSTTRSRLEVQLHHTHFPLLDEANIIEYETTTDRIEPDQYLPLTETILETLPDDPTGTT